MNLTRADVAEIVSLLDNSAFDELRLETDKLKLVLQRSGAGGWIQDSETRAAESSAPTAAKEPRRPSRSRRARSRSGRR